MAQPMAYFDYKVFGSPKQGTYVETHLSFAASSLTFDTLKNGKTQARVGTTVIIQQNDKIVTFNKVEVKSPECPDSLVIDFLNLQRFSIGPGTYNIEVELVDLNKSENNTTTFKQAVIVDYPSTLAYVSDILFLADIKAASNPATSFTRGSQDMFPLVSNYFPEDFDHLMFYAELYNTKYSFNDSAASFALLYKIATPKTGKTFKTYQKVMKKKADEVVPILGNIDISNLPSGNYELVIEIRDPMNSVVSSGKRAFQRTNSNVVISDAEIEQMMLDNSFIGRLNSMDTLGEYIFCLRPIANDKERQVIDNQKEILNSLDLKKKFFYTFWANRNANEPANAWQDYKKEVGVAEALFKTRIKHGYETDRGRVYLQYGPPNVRTERPTEPSAYPYEIWHYYKIGHFSNKRFVFWNQDLSSNDYELLHSELFGEIKNPTWERMLSKRNNPIDNFDKTKPINSFGGRANDFYTNPR